MQMPSVCYDLIAMFKDEFRRTRNNQGIAKGEELTGRVAKALGITKAAFLDFVNGALIRSFTPDAFIAAFNELGYITKSHAWIEKSIDDWARQMGGETITDFGFQTSNEPSTFLDLIRNAGRKRYEH